MISRLMPFIGILTLPVFLGLINIASSFAHKPLSMAADVSGHGNLPNRNLVANLSPAKSSFFNKITFAWARGLMEIGNKRTLQLQDIMPLEEKERMLNISHNFEGFYKTEVDAMATKNVSVAKRSLDAFLSAPLSRAVTKMYWNPIVESGLLKFINTVVQFFPSLIVARILQTVDLLADAQGGALPGGLAQAALYKKGFILSALLFLSLGVKTVLENQYFHSVTTMGTSIRGALSAAVYKKSLRLSPTGRQNATTGEIVNLMQLDVGRLEGVATSIHILWDGLLQVVGYTSLLLYFLGPSVFAGIAVMLVVLPLQTIFFKRLSVLRSLMADFTDSRVKLTDEILQGVRAIKSYNWERYFKESLASIREKELKVLVESANMRAILVSVLSAAPSFVAVVTLAVYAYLGNDLSPAKVFTALALFNQLRFPLIFYPMVLNTLAEGRVSLDRLSKFFARDEVKPYIQSSVKGQHSAVEIRDGSFSWSSENDDPRGQLKDVNIKIQEGELVAVVGPVGSGKSSLLQALLGELHLERGEVFVGGKVGYVPQGAWIPNDSLRGVILFGNDYNETRYREVVDACCLEKDISMLEGGDLTEIGERGVNLSGGQKQRASIARAVYEPADVFLFDDPLSALDSDVGSQVFEKCIKGYMKNKTRILVTHKLSVLSQVDRIIVMERSEEGHCRVRDQGSIRELVGRGFDFKSLQEQEAKEEEASSNPVHPVAPEFPIPGSADEISPVITDKLEIPASSLEPELVPLPSSSSSPAHTDIAIIDCSSENAPPSSTLDAESPVVVSVSVVGAQKPGQQFTSIEERAEGAVGIGIYKSYIAAGNKPTLIAVTVMSFVMANFCQIFQQWIVAAWTSDPMYLKRSLNSYLSGVAIMASGVALFNYLRTYVGCLFGVAASKVLHLNMASRILRAPLSYFEATPAGRILQRFSKDLDSIDQQLPSSLGQFLASALQICGSMLAIMTISPMFTIALIPIFSIYLRVTNYYRTVARELKRLDSISRSPIYTHFSETLGGLSVIRAFKRSPNFLRGNEVRIDNNIATFNALKIVDRWLSVRLESLGNLIVLAAAALTITSGSRAGAAGISLNNALSVTSLLNWAVRNVAETESMMNSVERVLYISDRTPQELESYQGHLNVSSFLKAQPFVDRYNVSEPVMLPTSDNELVNSGWPWQGGIVLSDVKMRYRPDFDRVLKGVNLQIMPGEHVGVVGRTGSGKSSIFRALLRLTELEVGKIYVDGIDIASVGLDALRSGISIIPQDPVLFRGSIKTNLDPFGKLQDSDLWRALDKVNLRETVAKLPGGLSFEVVEGGENFSAGQRQLICLARALVRRSKLLLLDEATSSVDYETDALIQQTIKEEFKSCTVLTIAHRLRNVLDSDKILVMENGYAVEFDTPRNQLKNPNSLLFKLLASEGNIQSQEPVYVDISSDIGNDGLLASAVISAHDSSISLGIEVNATGSERSPVA